MACKEISGDGIASISIVVDNDLCRGIADAVARENAALAMRSNGLSWRQARRQAAAVCGTSEMYKAVAGAYQRGADTAALRNAAKSAARLCVIK